MKKVFFDLDGTLVDISEKYYRVYSGFMRNNEILAFPKNKFWQMMRRQENKEVLVKRKSLVDKYQKFFLENIEK